MDAEQKWALILREAKSSFARFGYRKTTVDDIAQAVEMTKSNLYFYVPSKRALYDQVVRRALIAWHEKVIRSLAGEHDLKRMLYLMAEHAFYYLNEDTQLCSIIAQDPAILSSEQREDRFDDVNQVSIDSLRGLLQQGVDAKDFRPIDVDLTAEFFFSIYLMMVIKAYVNKDQSAPEQFRQALDIVIQGILL